MTSTNDEREDLRECPFCGGDAHWCPTYIDRDTPGTVECANGCGATVICYGPKAERIAAWNNRSLPAPAPAAGEAVAWQRLHPQRGWLDCDPDDVSHYRAQGQEVRPLYAAPQATATGGELTAWAYVHPETGERDFSWDRDSARAKRCRQCGWTEIALANHSPDAGGVGEVVAWLRGTSHRAPLTIARQVADDIERGEHIADPALRPDPRGEG